MTRDPDGRDPRGTEEVDESRRTLLGLGAAGAGAIFLSACVPEVEDDVGEVSEELLDGVDAFGSYALIKALPPPTAGQHIVVFARGRSTIGDGGEGFFFWDPAETMPDDDGTVLVPTTNPSSGRWKREGTTGASSRHSGVVNVRWFGATGNGTTDDTVALQNALTAVRSRGGVLFFPPGRYVVTTTLDAGQAQGVRYQGGSGSSRASDFAAEGSTIAQFPTTLVWRGADGGGPLFKWSGHSCVFDGIAFQGGYDSDPSPTKPSAGFLVYPGTVSPINTGKAYFPSIHFNRCNVGMQVGTAQSSQNCDNLTFGRFEVDNCTTGFQVKNDMGMNFVFQSTKFVDVSTCFDFVFGGVLNVEHMFGVRTNVLLQIQGAGSGGDMFRIGFIKLDAQQNQRVVWVKQTGTNANIQIDGGVTGTLSNFGTPANTAAFQIQGHAVLRVRNVNGGMALGAPSGQPLLKITSMVDNHTAAALFENCCLDDIDPDDSADMPFLVQFAGTSGATWRKRWQIRDCYKGTTHNMVPDVGNLAAVRTGQATIAAGSQSVTVTHNLFGAGGLLNDNVFPRIFVQPMGADGSGAAAELVWVTDVTSSTFIARRVGTSGGRTFHWRAEVVQ